MFCNLKMVQRAEGNGKERKKRIDLINHDMPIIWECLLSHIWAPSSTRLQVHWSNPLPSGWPTVMWTWLASRSQLLCREWWSMVSITIVYSIESNLNMHLPGTCLHRRVLYLTSMLLVWPAQTLVSGGCFGWSSQQEWCLPLFVPERSDERSCTFRASVRGEASQMAWTIRHKQGVAANLSRILCQTMIWHCPAHWRQNELAQLHVLDLQKSVATVSSTFWPISLE